MVAAEEVEVGEMYILVQEAEAEAEVEVEVGEVYILVQEGEEVEAGVEVDIQV